MAQAAPWGSRWPGHTHRAACPGPPALRRSREGDALPPGVCFLERSLTQADGASSTGPSPSAAPHLPETLTFLSPWPYLASHPGLGSLS